MTFNCLASCYARPGTYPHCSDCYLNWFTYRQSHIINTLLSLINHRKKNVQFLALQEIDHPQEICFQLQNNSFATFYEQKPNGKQDGLLIAWNVSQWKLYQNSEPFVIQLNQFSDACSSENSQNYYRKDFIAIYAIFEHRYLNNQFLILINTHLYWKPTAHDIRLRQIAYILNVVHLQMQILRKQQQMNADIAVIFCGDFNMLPNTMPFIYMKNGSFVMKGRGNLPLKLIMDSPLNKVARWCRSMGIDVAYFPKENALKDKKVCQELFDICNTEDRTLITCSKNLVARRECPAQHLLLKNSNGKQNLRQIIKYFGLTYDENILYTRCTLCNGLFRVIEEKDEIMTNDQIPDGLKKEFKESTNVNESDQTTFWECLNCKQVYWWGKKTELEASKFKDIVDDVYANENINERKENDNNNNCSDVTVDYASKKEKQKMEVVKKSNMKQLKFYTNEEIHGMDELLPNLQRFFWKDVMFNNAFENRMVSSFAFVHNGEEPKYTNKTSAFEGCLDYIYYENDGNLLCTQSCVIEGNGESYPNESWSSDHTLLCSTFQILKTTEM